MKLKVTEKEFLKHHENEYHAAHRVRWPRFLVTGGIFIMYVVFIMAIRMFENPALAYIGVGLFVLSFVPITVIGIKSTKRAKIYAQDLLKCESEPFLTLSRERYEKKLIQLYKHDNYRTSVDFLIVIGGVVMLIILWNVDGWVRYFGILVFTISFIPAFVVNRRITAEAKEYATEEMKK